MRTSLDRQNSALDEGADDVVCAESGFDEFLQAVMILVEFMLKGTDVGSPVPVVRRRADVELRKVDKVLVGGVLDVKVRLLPVLSGF